VPQTAIVQPYGGAIGGEQAIGPVAEAVETGAKIQRGRHAGRNVGQQVSQLALEVVVAAKSEQLERGDQAVGNRRGLIPVARVIDRGAEADRKQTEPPTVLQQRQEQRGVGRREPDRQIGQSSSGIRHERRSAAVEDLVDDCLLGRGSHPGLGVQLIKAEARARPQLAVAGVVFEEQ
jgi:hypothetical protein